MSFSDFELPIAFGRGRSVVAFSPTALLLTFLASERTEFAGPLFATGTAQSSRFRLSISTHPFTVFLLSHIGSHGCLLCAANEASDFDDLGSEILVKQ